MIMKFLRKLFGCRHNMIAYDWVSDTQNLAECEYCQHTAVISRKV